MQAPDSNATVVSLSLPTLLVFFALACIKQIISGQMPHAASLHRGAHLCSDCKVKAWRHNHLKNDSPWRNCPPAPPMLSHPPSPTQPHPTLRLQPHPTLTQPCACPLTPTCCIPTQPQPLPLPTPPPPPPPLPSPPQPHHTTPHLTLNPDAMASFCAALSSLAAMIGALATHDHDRHYKKFQGVGGW